MKTRDIVLVCVAACAVAIAGCGRKHTATAMLRVAAEQPRVLPGQAGKTSDEKYTAYKEEQRAFLTSRLVLLVALNNPQVATLPSVQTQLHNGDPVQWLADIVKVKCPGDAEVMSVSCAMRDPHEAVALTNAVVDAYMTEIVDAKQERNKRKLDAMDQLIREHEMRLQEQQAELKRLRAPSSAGNTKAAPSAPDSAKAAELQSQIKSAERVLATIRGEREKMQTDLKQLPSITVMQRAEEPAASK
jgi:uncharacterized protein involved in exopolysaccharide biosynthesis